MCAQSACAQRAAASDRTGAGMSRGRVKPSRPPSRLLQAVLAVGVVALGFATLLVRVEVTQEGYRLSTLRDDNLKLEEENRGLRLGVAEIASREHLRALAPKFNLGPPAPGLGRGRTRPARPPARAGSKIQPGSARAGAGGDAAVNEPFRKRRVRIGALTIVLAALFLLIALRLAALVVFDGPRLTSLARMEHTGEVAGAAPRGPRPDPTGEPLALSAETRSVYARPPQVLAASSAQDRAPLAAAVRIAPSELEGEL